MNAKNLVLILGGFLIMFYMSYRILRSTQIDKEVNQLLVQSSILLDVRTAWEYKRGGLPNSVNIRMSDLRTSPIPIDKDKPIITYCSHGMRSIKAKKMLKERGYTKVYNGGAMDDLEVYFN